MQEGHEGTGEVIGTVDTDLADLLGEMEDSGEMNRTVLVLTSDHGSHMGPYYMSGAMGELEQRLPLLIMTYPKWFLDKYGGFRGNLQAQEQTITSHYDTHWTFRHLATLPEFGGNSSNYQPRSNSYTDVWDCAHNRDYMEVAYQFRGYIFTRAISYVKTATVLDLAKACFQQLGFEPRVLNRSTIPLELLATSNTDVNKPFVEEAITDKFAYYWFLDAVKYQELIDLKYGQRVSLPSANQLEMDVANEAKAWDSLRAPGTGRYIFGRSLLKYSDPRPCKEAGIPICPCTPPRAKHLRGSN